MSFEVVSYDDDSFLVKVYKSPSGAEMPPAPTKRTELTAEEKEKIAASYRAETGVADRLTFAPFDKGLPSRGQWRNALVAA
jgi:hypothetical protein